MNSSSTHNDCCRKFVRHYVREVHMSEKIKPGQPAPKSGQYAEVGPRGGSPSKTEITAVEGKPMPPTSKPGNAFVLVDETKHKKK